MQIQWEKVQEIFDLALSVSPEKREEYLVEICHDDEALHAEVLSLLRWHTEADDFLESRAFALSLPELEEMFSSSLVGKRIGSYKVLEELGSGGMGTVYAAARADGEFEQTVALKVVSAVRPGPKLRRRFHAERQILARLHHPHIAQLLDGGTTPEGQPYLVMEFVDGADLCTYADEHRLSIRGRLRLFLLVCSAVQAAHQALIVHCDLKPSNVLVTRDGFPKLVDFGIASVLAQSFHGLQSREDLDGESGSGTPLMSSAQLGLTPAYASPEQLAGAPPTTAADLYSLGVLLGVLLCGNFPFEADNLANNIRKPLPPSLCLRSVERDEVASRRGAERKQLARSLRGDLDAIVLRAIAFDPQRRYVTVEQLAADIKGHLDLRPIAACAGSRWYRATKFFARNRLSSLAAFGFVVALLAGTLGVLWQARAAERASAQAVRRFEDVRRVAYSVLFELSDAVQGLPGSTRAQVLLAQRANAFLSQMAQDAPDDSSFMRDLARSYRKLGTMQGLPFAPNIGDTKGAIHSFREAVRWGELARAKDPGNTEGLKELASAYDELGSTQGSGSESIGFLEKAIAIDSSLIGSHPERPDFANALALDYQHVSPLFRNAGDSGRAMDVLQRSLTISDRLVRDHPTDVSYKTTLSFSCKRLGGLLIKERRWNEALELYLRSLTLDTQTSAGKANDFQKQYNATFAMDDIGYIYWHRGDPTRGLSWYSRSLAIRKGAFAADPTNRRTEGGVATIETYMGQIEREQKHWKRALTYQEAAYDIRKSLAIGPSRTSEQMMELLEAELNVAKTYRTWHQVTGGERNSYKAWSSMAERTGTELLQSNQVDKDQRKIIEKDLQEIRAEHR